MMYIRRFPLHSFVDPRGSLIQNDYPELFASFKHFLLSRSAPGIIRGNHYHQHKREWFMLVTGEAEFFCEDIASKERQSIKLSAATPELVETVPYVAHAIKNIGSTEMHFLGFINEVFDLNATDTFAYQVI